MAVRSAFNVLILGLSLTHAVPASAGVQPVGGETLVNTRTKGLETDSVAAFAPNGDYVIVWELPDTGLLGRFFRGSLVSRNDNGSSARLGVAGEVRLVADGPLPPNPGAGDFMSRHHPSVVYHPSGDFFLFWTEQLAYVRQAIFMESREVKEQDVWGCRFDPLGRPVGEAFVVSDVDDVRELRPKAALVDEETLVVVWETLEGVGNEAVPGVAARLIDTSGQVLGDPLQLGSGPAYQVPRPAVASDDEGRFLIAWAGLDDSESGIRARLFEPSGAPVADEAVLNTITAGSQQAVAVAAGADGSFLVAWQGAVVEEEGVRYRILGRRLDATTGAGLGSDFRISPAVDSGDGAPTLALLPSGRYAALWINWLRNYPYAVRGAELDAAGQKVGDVFTVSRYLVLAQWRMGLAAGATGELVATWTGFPDGVRGVSSRRLWVE
jgi:hypothetical protein